MTSFGRLTISAIAALSLTWVAPAQAQQSSSPSSSSSGQQQNQPQQQDQPQQNQQQQQSQTQQQDQNQQQQQQPGSQQMTTPAASTVELDEVEENADRYFGERVTVSGEIQEVLGPQAFSIDEVNWIDFDGETLVVLPSPLAALVRESQPVAVTGTVRPLAEVDIDRDWGWFDDAELEVEYEDRAVIVAESVTTTEGVTLIEHFDVTPGGQASGASASQGQQPMSQQSAAQQAPITNVSQVAQATDDTLVGRRVQFDNATVSGTAERGFWIGEPQQRVFVRPTTDTTVQEGDRVSVEGTVLQLPRNLHEQIDAGEEAVYVYARSVQPQGQQQGEQRQQQGQQPGAQGQQNQQQSAQQPEQQQ